MQLRIFSVVGEALNFGGRRMDTIARVSWLPVVLLLIVNMVTVFAYLTIIAERVITFEDAGTFATAKEVLQLHIGEAWQTNPFEMWAVTGGSLFLQAILIASFLAPLIRYSGLGEKPHSGFFRMPFGPDQVRCIISLAFSTLFVPLLILAPMAGASYYVLKYIFDALSKTTASFPDPQSLHTIELVTAGDQMIGGGASWYLNLGLPLLAAAPFALVLWVLVYLHFHPRNRPNASDGANPALRAMATLGVAGLAACVAYWVMSKSILQAFNTAGGANENLGEIIAKTPVNAHLLIGAIIFLLVGYLSLRLFPYPGVAVCRKSLAFGDTLRVSRGWNLIRLQAILLLVIAFIFLVQTVFLNNFLLSVFLPWIVYMLYEAVTVSTKLVNSGVTAEWVLPLFTWLWNGVKILINIVGTLFSYGVIAGLYGRLYRESEREESDAPQPSGQKAIWRRN